MRFRWPMTAGLNSKLVFPAELNQLQASSLTHPYEIGETESSMLVQVGNDRKMCLSADASSTHIHNQQTHVRMQFFCIKALQFISCYINMHKMTPRRPLEFGNMSGGAFLAGGHSRGYAYVSTYSNCATHARMQRGMHNWSICVP